MPRQHEPIEEFGHFLVIRPLKTGGMGTVHVAYNRRADRIGALKRSISREQAERFQDEQKLAAVLAHPHLVPVQEVGTIDDTPYVEMDYLGGKDLATLNRRLARFSESVVRALMFQICSALEYAHSSAGLKFVHRDISPANIMIDYAGRAILLDYGLSWFNEKRYRTGVGLAPGTQAFAAPEQLFLQPIDQRSDLYALGAVAWTLLVGHQLRPLQVTAEDVVRPVPSVRSFVSEISDDMDALLGKALQLDANHRFASASDLSQALGGADPVAASETLKQFLLSYYPDDERIWRERVAADLHAIRRFAATEASRPAAPARRAIFRRGPTVAIAGSLLGLGAIVGLSRWRRFTHDQAAREPAPIVAPSPVAAAPIQSITRANPSDPEEGPEVPLPRTVQSAVTNRQQRQRVNTASAVLPPTWASIQDDIAAKRFRSATRALDQLEVEGMRPLAALGRAQLEYERDNYARAIELATEALRGNVPAESQALLLRGEARLRIGDSPSAALDFRRVLKLRPASTEARSGLERARTEIEPVIRR